MSEVLTYIDFNSAETARPVFGLKTVLFHSLELLSSNHLELVTKLCPSVEWLSLDSALFYSLEGLGHLPHLSLLRLNYKSRPVDATVVDFFRLSCSRLTCPTSPCCASTTSPGLWTPPWLTSSGSPAPASPAPPLPAAPQLQVPACGRHRG